MVGLFFSVFEKNLINKLFFSVREIYFGTLIITAWRNIFIIGIISEIL